MNWIILMHFLKCIVYKRKELNYLKDFFFLRQDLSVFPRMPLTQVDPCAQI